jgi:hypothetical protein
MKPQNDFVAQVATLLRGQMKKHPEATTVASFIPGANDVIDAAAVVDPTSTGAEKMEGVAGLIPGLDLIKALRQRGPGMMDMVGGMRRSKKPPPNSETWIDPYGSRKFEIPDEASMLDTETLKKLGSTNLGSVFQHPALYEQYPQLASYKIKVEDLGPNLRGRYRRIPKEIVLNSRIIDNPAWSRSTVLHEGTHAIQNIEDFVSKGASLAESESFQKYLSNLGEVEARVTQMRKNWTPEQRAAVPMQEHIAAELRRLEYIPRKMAEAGYRSQPVVDYKLQTEWYDAMMDPKIMAKYLRRYRESGPDPSRDRRIKPSK